MTITEKKKLKLLQIEQARNKLSIYLENGFITEEDVLSLLSVKINYGLKFKNRQYTYKQSVMKSIFNSPFVLCDQKHLSLNVKQILPIFLNSRYYIELEELDHQKEEGYMSLEEYIEEKKLLEFCYYKSSIEGKEILKNGHVSNVLDSTIKVR